MGGRRADPRTGLLRELSDFPANLVTGGAQWLWANPAPIRISRLGRVLNARVRVLFDARRRNRGTKTMKHFETAILAFGLMLVALPVVRAADTTCPPNPSPGSTVNGNLIVPANASCTVTSTLTVTNNVVVGTGASLGVFPVDGQTVTIDGNIIADQCNSVAIQTFGDGVFSVGGNVNIQNCTGPVNGYSGIRVTIGGNFLCANSGVCVAGDGVVQGNLTMDNNNAVSEVDDNQIGGNVDVSGNSGSAPTVLGNRIGGNLQCFNNNPPPSNFGFPNSVSGNERGQCVGF